MISVEHNKEWINFRRRKASSVLIACNLSWDQLDLRFDDLADLLGDFSSSFDDLFFL